MHSKIHLVGTNAGKLIYHRTLAVDHQLPHLPIFHTAKICNRKFIRFIKKFTRYSIESTEKMRTTTELSLLNSRKYFLLVFMFLKQLSKWKTDEINSWLEFMRNFFCHYVTVRKFTWIDKFLGERQYIEPMPCDPKKYLMYLSSILEIIQYFTEKCVILFITNLKYGNKYWIVVLIKIGIFLSSWIIIFLM